MARAREPDQRGSGGHVPSSGASAPGSLDDLDHAVVVCRPDGRIVAANDALHQLLGHEPGSLIGTSLESLVPTELRELHHSHRVDFTHDPGPGGHRGGRLFPALHRDGHRVPVDISVGNLRTEGGTLSVALLRDLRDPEAAGRQVRHLADLHTAMAHVLSLLPRAATAPDLWAAACDVLVDRGLTRLVWVSELVDDDLVPAVVSGPLTDAVEGLDARLGDDSPLALALTLDSAVVVPDLGLEPVFRADPATASGARSLCAVPLRQGGASHGVLVVTSPLLSGFTDAAVTVLEWLADELSAAADRLAVRHATDARTESRLAALAAQHEQAVATATAAAVAEALAAERAAVDARTTAEAAAWGRAVEEAVVEARALERAEVEAALGEALSEREQALARAVDEARAEVRAAVRTEIEAARRAHEEALEEAVATTRAEERTAAAVRLRYAEDAHARDLARAVEEARAEERAATEDRLRAERAAETAADDALAAEPGRAARMEAHVARQDVAVQLALLALATADPSDVADAVVGAAGRTLGVDSAVLVESGVDERAEVRAAWFGTEPTAGEYQADRHADLHDVVVVRGGPLVVRDLAADERFQGLVDPDDHASAMAVAVGGAPGFHGSMSVLATEPRTFDDDEVRFLDRLAELIAAAFERDRDQAVATAPPVPTPSSEGDARPGLDGTVNDPLTGLPNRALLTDRTEQLVGRIEDPDQLVGILVVRVDDLGRLTSGQGPGATDALLVSIAGRLRGAAAADPEAVVARPSVDSFAVLHTTAGAVDDFADLADRLRVSLAAPHVVGGVSLEATFSIGVSVRPAGDAAAGQLLQEAETAAARASGLGRSRTEIYDHDLRRQARVRIDQAAALRRAVDDDELVVVWQAALPIQPAEDEQAEEVWAEALVRWRNPERGLVSPGNFMALAEETGLIVPVGDAVLRKACEQLVAWRATDGLHPRRVSVNLSPRQLAHEGLATSVAEALDAHRLEPGAVIFEITETAVTAGPEDAIRRLNELRDLGVGLALDDFGTGYSSLGYLRRMPVSVLKIDQSFIRGLTTHRADWAIVHGIVEMAHGIGLTVVAEGIETAQQLEHLVALGCDRGQGYFWSSPVPAEALGELLENWSAPGRRT